MPMRFAVIVLVTSLSWSPALAAGWTVDVHAAPVAGRTDSVATASDPGSGGEVLLQCVRGMRTAYVSVNDTRNAFNYEGEAATVYVQGAGSATNAFAGTLRAKRDGRAVFEIEGRSFADAFADGEERLTVNTPYVHYLSVFDLAGTADALAPVRACKD